MSLLQSTIQKFGFLDQATNEHYLSILRKQPQNKWVRPTNRKSEEYTFVRGSPIME